MVIYNLTRKENIWWEDINEVNEIKETYVTWKTFKDNFKRKYMS